DRPADERRRARRVGQGPECDGGLRAGIRGRVFGADEVLLAGSAEGVARLERERQLSVGVLETGDVAEGDRAAGIRADLWDDADLDVLEGAVRVEGKHVRGQVERLVVDAETGVVGPVIALRRVVDAGVERVVPPRSERVRTLRNREQEPGTIR